MVRIDAVFGDTAVVNEWLKQNATLAPVGEKVTDKAYFGTKLGIAIRTGNTDLQTKFNDGFTLNFGLFQLPIQVEIENFDVSPFLCGVIALVMLYAAYTSQTLREALKAVPVGQWESGQALGMKKSAIFLRLIMP